MDLGHTSFSAKSWHAEDLERALCLWGAGVES